MHKNIYLYHIDKNKINSNEKIYLLFKKLVLQSSDVSNIGNSPTKLKLCNLFISVISNSVDSLSISSCHSHHGLLLLGVEESPTGLTPKLWKILSKAVAAFRLIQFKSVIIWWCSIHLLLLIGGD